MAGNLTPTQIANAPQDVVDAYRALPEKRRAFALNLPGARTLEAAALAAGYTANVANKNAGRIAGDPRVRKVADWLAGQALQAKVLDIDRLQREICAIAHADPRKLFDEKGKLKNMFELDDDIAKAVSGFEFAEGVVSKQKVTMHSKLDAIEKALKLLAAYPREPEKGPTTTIVGVVVVPARGGYKHPEKPAITGQAQRVERVAPPQPSGKQFKVTRQG